MNIGKDYELVATGLSDIELIRPLWEQLHDHNRSLHRRFFGRELHQTWADYLHELRKRSDLCRLKITVFKRGDIAVGYCLSSINSRSEGEIVSLFVLPELRGQEIGSRLMREHLQWFRENHVKSVYLYVHPCNVDAIRFYWRFHFFSSSPLMELCEPEPDLSGPR